MATCKMKGGNHPHMKKRTACQRHAACREPGHSKVVTARKEREKKDDS